jgi:hypothetical protein
VPRSRWGVGVSDGSRSEVGLPRNCSGVGVSDRSHAEGVRSEVLGAGMSEWEVLGVVCGQLMEWC